MNDTKKTILAKNMENTTGNALFSFETDGYLEYVVATLYKEDEQKQVGETVKDWSWGHYFGQDVLSACKYLINKDSKKDFTIIKLSADNGIDYSFENRIKIFAKLDDNDIIKIENKISDFGLVEENWQPHELYRSVFNDLEFEWEYADHDYEIEIEIN